MAVTPKQAARRVQRRWIDFISKETRVNTRAAPGELNSAGGRRSLSASIMLFVELEPASLQTNILTALMDGTGALQRERVKEFN